MKLDSFADQTIIRLNDHTGRLAAMASEEHADFMPIPERYPKGKYVLLFDPLDGSSNVDYNVPVGTIFAVYRRVTEVGAGTIADFSSRPVISWRPGISVYGTSTMLVYSTGNGVHGFTLDSTVASSSSPTPAS